MDDLKARLCKFRNDHGLNQEEMSAVLGIGYRTYQTIEASGKVKKAEDLITIEAKLSEEVPDLTRKNENTKEFAHAKVKGAEGNRKTGSVDKLIDATKILAETNKIYAEAHKTIADTNERLSLMLERGATASDAQQMLEGALARQQAIWEVLQDYSRESKPLNIETFEVDVNRRIAEKLKAGARKEHTQNG